MSTQRPKDDNIITSGVNSASGTSRVDAQIISSEIHAQQILSSSSISTSVSNSVVLNGIDYIILKQIARSGESEVYLIEGNGRRLVFKYYFSHFKPKDEILKKLKGLSHPDILALIDYGYYQNRFFEILEFAEGGTLLDIAPIKNLSILKDIIKEAAEALNYCHTHGIIHRDIKPHNMFYRLSNKKDMVIGDFGISSALEEGFSKHFTGQARTTMYAAPEVFQSLAGKTIISNEVDYYSLGITLIHLWTGEDPFKDLPEFGIMRMKIEGRVFIPDDMPEEFKNLIKGLITVEPPKRWSYDHVQRWLKGERVEVYYKTAEIKYKEFPFGRIDGEDIIIQNPADLAELLEKYPDKGKKHLYKHTIAEWLKSANQGLYIDIMSIVEEDFPKKQDAGLIKAIYVLSPEKPFKSIDGTICLSKEEIASCFEKNFQHYSNDLLDRNAPFYLFLEARGYKKEADKFRSLFKASQSESALNQIIL